MLRQVWVSCSEGEDEVTTVGVLDQGIRGVLSSLG
jgi:hypothetical protein